MRQSSASLIFALLFLIISFWIIWVAFQKKEREEPVILEEGPARFWEKIEGDTIRYKSYDGKGERTLEVQAEKIEQLPGLGTVVSGTRAMYRKPDGKILRITADLLRDEGVNKVFSSKDGGKIVLEEEGGLKYETIGPLIVTPKLEFVTRSKTTFQFREWSGECLSLYYLPDQLLDLNQDVTFNFGKDREATTIQSKQFLFNLEKGVGTIHYGQITMFSIQTEQEMRSAYFESERMVLYFSGGKQKIPLSLVELEISGPDSHLFWNEGGLTSPFISVCMDNTERYPQLITTNDPTEFTLISSSGKEIHGITGSLKLDFFETQPLQLLGDSELILETQATSGKVLTIKGGTGFLTEFNQGKAENSRIFGAPVFELDGISGRAGFLRILHGQRKLIMSQTAELHNKQNNTSLSAEEILVSNWDLADREIFGRAFIRLKGDFMDGEVHGTGDEIFFSDYQGVLTLKGSPAVFQDSKSAFSAKDFQINFLSGKMTQATASGDVTGKLESAGRVFDLECQKMVYEQQTSICTLHSVDNLSGPEMGSISAQWVELAFDPGQSRALKEVNARGNIQLTGRSMQNGEPKQFSGQADHLNLDFMKQILTLEGDERDVVLQNDSGDESKGRRLIYSLLNATMRIEAGEHGSTQTIVNIKKEKSK